MPYKTIAAILAGENDTPRLIERISVMIRFFGAHVTALHAEPSPAAHVAVLAGDMVSIDEKAIEAARKRMEDVQRRFVDHCVREGISHEWRGVETFTGDSATASLQSVQAADLVVVQQPDPDRPETLYTDLETLLFDGGRPVLMMPYIDTGPFDPKRIAIAWKASAESARAVFDALPLLHRAREVEIIVVDAKQTEERRPDMAAGLPVGDVISNMVSETGADLLVMGAYSHSPVRELLFGGVTRTLLKTMTVPVLLSH
jgi:nucleotide-binding universal stress UspA family protein